MEIRMARKIDGGKNNIVGDMVRQCREERNWSQEELSAKLELMGVYVCRGSFSRIESGTRTVTDIELYALANAFGITLDELFSKCSMESIAQGWVEESEKKSTK